MVIPGPDFRARHDLYITMPRGPCGRSQSSGYKFSHDLYALVSAPVLILIPTCSAESRGLRKHLYLDSEWGLVGKRGWISFPWSIVH